MRRVRNGYFKIVSLRLRVRVCLPVPAFTAGVPALLAGVGGEVLVSGHRVGLVDHTLVRSQPGHAVTPRVLRGKQWRPGTFTGNILAEREAVKGKKHGNYHHKAPPRTKVLLYKVIVVSYDARSLKGFKKILLMENFCKLTLYCVAGRC